MMKVVLTLLLLALARADLTPDSTQEAVEILDNAKISLDFFEAKAEEMKVNSNQEASTTEEDASRMYLAEGEAPRGEPDADGDVFEGEPDGPEEGLEENDLE